MLDILFHRVPWNGDKIRLYRNSENPIDRFLGEHWVKIQSQHVFISGHGFLHRNLPKWSKRFGCWEYTYDE